MLRSPIKRWTVVVGVAASATALALTAPTAGAARGVGSHTSHGFRQVNLVSDVPGLARLTDADVRNPWGIALGTGSSATPLWVANNGTATATVYRGANGTDPVTKLLRVTTSPAPTGQVFNSTSGFSFRASGQLVPSRFLFDTAGGAVAAWSNVPAPAPSTTDVALVRNRTYLGLAIAQTPAGPRLYAADATGGVDVFDRRFRLIARPHAFQDPDVPAGLTPYNVAVIGGRVLVSYASEEDTAVKGAVSVFDYRGRFLRRLITGHHLEGPWGMVVAPAHWGRFGGALLVGNEDGGEIHAYDRHTGRFLGTVRDRHGQPIANDGLWGLAFGNGVFGRPTDLIFAAGIDHYAHGLIGVIRPD